MAIHSSLNGWISSWGRPLSPRRNDRLYIFHETDNEWSDKQVQNPGRKLIGVSIIANSSECSPPSRFQEHLVFFDKHDEWDILQTTIWPYMNKVTACLSFCMTTLFLRVDTPCCKSVTNTWFTCCVLLVCVNLCLVVWKKRPFRNTSINKKPHPWGHFFFAGNIYWRHLHRPPCWIVQVMDLKQRETCTPQLSTQGTLCSLQEVCVEWKSNEIQNHSSVSALQLFFCNFIKMFFSTYVGIHLFHTLKLVLRPLGLQRGIREFGRIINICVWTWRLQCITESLHSKLGTDSF